MALSGFGRSPAAGGKAKVWQKSSLEAAPALDLFAPVSGNTVRAMV